MALQRCPHCGNPLTQGEYRAGICPACKQAHREYHLQKAEEFQDGAMATESAVAQKFTVGQRILVVLFFVAVFFMVASAIKGNRDGISFVAKIGGKLLGFLLVAAILGSCGLVRRLFSWARRS